MYFHMNKPKLIITIIVLLLIIGFGGAFNKNYINKTVKTVTENVEQEISEGGMLAIIPCLLNPSEMENIPDLTLQLNKH
jgi:hypothetical protein